MAATNYEWKVQGQNLECLEDVLNDLSSDGWEVYTILYRPGDENADAWATVVARRVYVPEEEE
jgi:hypothetical protein